MDIKKEYIKTLKKAYNLGAEIVENEYNAFADEVDNMNLHISIALKFFERIEEIEKIEEG